MDVNATDTNCFLLPLGCALLVSLSVGCCLYLALEIKQLAELKEYRKCHATVAFSLVQSLFILGQGK